MSLKFGRGDRRFIYWISLQGVGLCLLIWVLLAGYAMLHGGANWPWQPQRVVLTPGLRSILPTDVQAALLRAFREKPEERAENNATVFLLASLLFTKTWAMYRRTIEKDGLAWSIIISNLTFSVLYFYAMLSALLPGWGTGIWAHRAVRWPMIAAALVTFFFINTVQDGESDVDDEEFLRRLEAERDDYRARVISQGRELAELKGLAVV